MTMSKLSAKQVQEIHNHMKRHGCSYDSAKEAVLGGWGDGPAEKEAMYAERRIQARIGDRVMMAALPRALAALAGRRRR